ncbi:MAG: HAMP domain-containing histidine kinase [Balneolaceae bacterium]|nr:HAMP domain-containing histidine kinase [Balneolaceae bacterium]
MKIRSKLAWTYIILLIIGIITISAYSILTIRAFLLKEGITKFKQDTQSIALAASSFSNNEKFPHRLRKEAKLTGYQISVYSSDGMRFLAIPDSALAATSSHMNAELLNTLEEEAGQPVIVDEGTEQLVSYVKLEESANEAQYLRISQNKQQYYAAAASIRHIIYGGMFFSIGAVVIVSFLFARYMASPIQKLNRAALDIARGNLDRKIDLKRDDEFGTLADSLNHMAKTLRSDNEQLKKLNEKQSRFFADITHEVRNPLHTISGALEMLDLKGLEVEKKRKYIKTAQKQIKRVTRLFEDIKTLQRYDFDENFINEKEFDIARSIEETFNAYLPIAEEKGLDLELAGEQSCWVYADPDKIEQVLENLLSNAIKYTVKGKVKIGVQLASDSAEVFIEDTGLGIGEEHLEQLFDRFYRTDKARSRDKGGTGLGLSVVKGILSAHQSEIKVKSELGTGSRFYFKLPLSPSRNS